MGVAPARPSPRARQTLGNPWAGRREHATPQGRVSSRILPQRGAAGARRLRVDREREARGSRRLGRARRGGPAHGGNPRLEAPVVHSHLQVSADQFAYRFNRRRPPVAAFQTLLGFGAQHPLTTFKELYGVESTGEAHWTLLALGGPRAHGLGAFPQPPGRPPPGSPQFRASVRPAPITRKAPSRRRSRSGT